MKREHWAALSFGLAPSILCASAAMGLMQDKAPPTIETEPASPLQQTAPTQHAHSGASAANHWIADYGQLPLAFEANAGQTDGRVKFLSRGRGYTVFLTGDEAVLALSKAAHPARTGKPAAGSLNHLEAVELLRPVLDSLLRMRLVGANVNAAVAGADELAGKSNYFNGNDPKKWRTNVPNYARVKYPSVYPGVDLVYCGNQSGQLEYDFVVAPGADPSPITLDVAAESVHPVTNLLHGKRCLERHTKDERCFAGHAERRRHFGVHAELLRGGQRRQRHERREVDRERADCRGHRAFRQGRGRWHGTLERLGSGSARGLADAPYPAAGGFRDSRRFCRIHGAGGGRTRLSAGDGDRAVQVGPGLRRDPRRQRQLLGVVPTTRCGPRGEW